MDVLAGLNKNCQELEKREEHYNYKIQEQKQIILKNGKKNLSGAWQSRSGCMCCADALQCPCVR